MIQMRFLAPSGLGMTAALNDCDDAGGEDCKSRNEV